MFSFLRFKEYGCATLLAYLVSYFKLLTQMKISILAFVLLLFVISTSAQISNPNHKFSADELKADLSFVKQQLFNAHANPFTEITQPEYERVFNGIEAQITDSMTATAFFKKIRPVMAYLSDEHSQISINPSLQTAGYKVGEIFLPFSLSTTGGTYRVDDVLAANADLKKGDIVAQVDGTPIASLIKQCAEYATGFPVQRTEKALQQFGYLYNMLGADNSQNFEVKTARGKTISVKGTTLKTWTDYLVKTTGQSGNAGNDISYTRYGDAGYINCTAFNAHNDKEMDSLRRVVATIFGQIKADGVKNLFIDVSRNGGGNSAVGDMLTDFFYGKPYKGYQCNWKRSDEYLSLIKSWGMHDDFYTKQPVGKVIHFDAQEIKPSGSNPVRFKGKVFVIIGDGTFSSAIMFATTIKDNHIATLIGKEPQDGHPNHFGELYNTKLPNTKLDLRFGVKEWIRPAGKTGENILRPDIAVDLNRSPEEIIRSVLK